MKLRIVKKIEKNIFTLRYNEEYYIIEKKIPFLPIWLRYPLTDMFFPVVEFRILADAQKYIQCITTPNRIYELVPK